MLCNAKGLIGSRIYLAWSVSQSQAPMGQAKRVQYMYIWLPSFLQSGSIDILFGYSTRARATSILALLVHISCIARAGPWGRRPIFLHRRSHAGQPVLHLAGQAHALVHATKLDEVASCRPG